MRDLNAVAVLGAALAEGRLAFRDRARLEAHQERLARAHLRWVLAHSPATAARFRDAGLDAGRWRELPPVDKRWTLEHFDTLNTEGLTLAQVREVGRAAEASRDFRPTLRGRTGEVVVGLSTGTSGMQGVFVVSRAERQRWAGTVLRHLLPGWPWALRRPQRVAFVLRAEGGLYRSVQGRAVDLRYFDLLRPLDALAAELSAYRPTVLVGPPSVLRALHAAGARARPARVVSVAEVLEDDDRAALGAAFGPVVQVYQATEGLLGLPCAHGHLHLNEAHVHIDLEPLGGDRSRPVVTDLRRRAQPVIRHRLDDVLHVDPQPCPCGLASRRVLHIAGRQDDALRLPGPDGQPVTVWPDFLRGALAALPGVHEYGVAQVDAATVTVGLVPLTPDTAGAACAAIRHALRRAGVDEARVTLVPELLGSPPPGRKRRRVTRVWTPPLEAP
ncbi:putative adenylate-forming enzyme [Deinococcus metalli]|uniref:Coenzyme F390 synthetase n=1 Tax=Deinococcus metalli TaxID=1141878 RepID=A0A7W8NMK2_9DEIO|nr:F390 synthetase-related protein [Deinococcus metalli]MBB5375889.1 putative adenylate-forming enzyme [Deinococcus metalli]GHF36283.1 coenzyme F390 synthetase [Deinococcus metalli]